MLVNMLSTFCHIRMLFSLWLPLSDGWCSLIGQCYDIPINLSQCLLKAANTQASRLSYLLLNFWVLVLSPAVASAESLESILKKDTHSPYLLLGLCLGPG